MEKVKFSSLINESEEPVLVDFYADWCTHCQTLAPVLKQVAGQLKDELTIVKINVDHNKSASTQYKVRGLPTLILFHKGEVLWKKSGSMSESQLVEKMQSLISAQKEVISLHTESV